MTKENDKQAELTYLPLTAIKPNPNQPRRHFDEDGMLDLTESIRQNGVLSPIIVTPMDEGYTLVAGERRWRAAKLANLTEIPVLIYHLEKQEQEEIALIENIQREALSPLEEAVAYQTLMESYGYSAQEVAERLGKSRAYVANLIRLLKLPEEIKTLVAQNQLSSGHARALLALEDELAMLDMAKLVLDNGLSVRALENLIKESKLEFQLNKPVQKAKKPVQKDKNYYYSHIENQLEEHFQTKVMVTKGRKHGQLTLQFYNEEDLSRLLELMGIEVY